MAGTGALGASQGKILSENLKEQWGKSMKINENQWKSKKNNKKAIENNELKDEESFAMERCDLYKYVECIYVPFVLFGLCLKSTKGAYIRQGAYY